jgi:hypothetical protein
MKKNVENVTEPHRDNKRKSCLLLGAKSSSSRHFVYVWWNIKHLYMYMYIVQKAFVRYSPNNTGCHVNAVKKCVFRIGISRVVG